MPRSGCGRIWSNPGGRCTSYSTWFLSVGCNPPRTCSMLGAVLAGARPTWFLSEVPTPLVDRGEVVAPTGAGWKSGVSAPTVAGHGLQLPRWLVRFGGSKLVAPTEAGSAALQLRYGRGELGERSGSCRKSIGSRALRFGRFHKLRGAAARRISRAWGV